MRHRSSTGFGLLLVVATHRPFGWFWALAKETVTKTAHNLRVMSGTEEKAKKNDEKDLMPLRPHQSARFPDETVLLAKLPRSIREA